MWREGSRELSSTGRRVAGGVGGRTQPDTVPVSLLTTQLDWLLFEASTGGYEAADARAAAVEDDPKAAVAALLGADPADIAIVSSATQAWSSVFYGVDWRPGDAVVTTPQEYGSSVLAALQVAERRGVEVIVCPETPSGRDLDLAALDALLADLGPRCRLVSVVHVPTGSGRVYDAAGAGRVCRSRGVPLLLDACQSAGMLDLDVDALQCDFLTATGRKYMRGPRGSGFLWASPKMTGPDGPFGPAGHAPEPAADVRGAVWMPPEEDGGSVGAGPGRGSAALRTGAARYEQYEMSFAARAGLATAAREAAAALAAGSADRVCWLAARAREALDALPGVRIVDRGDRLCAIVAFTLEPGSWAGRHNEAVAALRRGGAATPTGLPVHVSLSKAPSSPWDYPHRTPAVGETLRASFHTFNDLDDVAALVGSVARLARLGPEGLDGERGGG